MKIAAIQIYTDWCRIVQEIPSYRLGQHYINVLGLRDTTFKGIDLFFVESVELSDKLFYEMCLEYRWDLFDLPVFGEYDLTTVKPV
tara:strand:- start:2896 stop:3153 length:258 start_codon:yes stop_codon:yes gene_type:complete